MLLIPKLGFLLIGFLARFFNLRLRFFSKQMNLEGVDFSLVHSKHDSSVWIPLKSRFIFKLNPEKPWDQWLKSIGLSQEFQTGDKEFDDRIYMASDSLSLNKHLAADEDLKKLIIDLNKLGFKQIIVDGKYFRIKFSKEHSFDNTYLSKVVMIFKQIEEIENKWRGNFHDPFAWKYLFTESLLWSFAAYGIATFIEFSSSEEAKYLDLTPLVKQGLIYGSLATLILIIIVVYSFRGSSRGHRIIIESIILLLIGLPVSCLGLLSDLNMHLDYHSTKTIELLIEDKSTHLTRTRSGSRTHYRLELEQKTNYRFYQLPRSLEVSSDLYHQAANGQFLIVEVAPGRFNFPWYKRMRVSPVSSVSKSK
jgi:hypothetical protein